MGEKSAPKEYAEVHAPLRGPAVSAVNAPNIAVPVTVFNHSTHTSSSGGRVVVRDFHSGNTAYVLFGEIPAGQQETENASWWLENDEQGQPIYPTSFLYYLQAEGGGGWHNLVEPGPFVSARIYVYDSDWTPDR